MAQISFKPNRAYPAIPTISGDSNSHSRALEAIKEALEIHERRTSDVLDSFVRVRELVDLGLISLDGTIVSDLPTDGVPSHDHDLVYIKLDGSSPPTFGVVDFGENVRFANATSINWLNAVGAGVELLTFEPSGVAGGAMDYVVQVNAGIDFVTSSTGWTKVTGGLEIDQANLVTGDRYYMFHTTQVYNRSNSVVHFMALFQDDVAFLDTSEWAESTGLTLPSTGGKQYHWSGIITAGASGVIESRAATNNASWDTTVVADQTLMINMNDIPNAVYDNMPAAEAIDMDGTINTWLDTPLVAASVPAGDCIVLWHTGSTYNNTQGNSPRFSILAGGVNYYGSSADVNTSNARVTCGGMMILENFAGGDIKVQYWTTTSSNIHTLEKGHIMVIPLSEFDEYYFNQVTDETTRYLAAVTTEETLLSTTNAVGASADWLPLAWFALPNTSTADQPGFAPKVNIDGGGITDVGAIPPTYNRRHSAATADDPIIWVSMGEAQTYTEGQSVELLGRGYVKTDNNIGYENEGIAMIKMSSPASQEAFYVGDPSYPTEIDGTLVGLKNNVGVNWDTPAGDNTELIIFTEGLVAPVDDPLWDQVVLLLPFEDADGATSTTDVSNSAHSPITFVGAGVEVSTDLSYFDTASLKFDGSGSDYVTIPDSADFALADEAFTLELDVYYTGALGTQTLISQYDASTNDRGWALSMTSTFLVFQWTTDGLAGTYDAFQETHLMIPDHWYRLSITRNPDNSGGTLNKLTMHVGGVYRAQKNTDDVIFNSSQNVVIGANGDGTNSIGQEMYIENIRLTTGPGAYRYPNTSNYPTPADSYPQATGTPTEFILGDPSYDTRIDGTLIGLKNNIGINWENQGGADVEALILNLEQIGSTAETIPDIDTLAYDSVSTGGDLDDDPFGLFFSSDGLNLFVGDIGANVIQKYPLGTAWDIETIQALAQTSAAVGTVGTTHYPTGVALNPDGTKVFVAAYGSKHVQTHTLSAAYDLSTLSGTPDTGETLTVFTSANITGLWFSDDGFNLAVVSEGSLVKTYSLSTAFELSSASFIDEIDIAVNPASCNGISMSNDGGTMWLTTRDSSKNIYQYTLSTPWDASTATYDTKTYTITYNLSSPLITAGFIEAARGEFFVIAKRGGVDTAVVEKATFTPQDITPIFEEVFTVGDPDYQLSLHGKRLVLDNNVGVNWNSSGGNRAEMLRLTAADDFYVGDPQFDAFIDGLTVDIRASGIEIIAVNTAGATIGGTLTIVSGAPKLFLQDDDATADEGNWIIANTTDQFRLETATDAAPTVSVESAMTIARTGTAVDSVTFPKELFVGGDIWGNRKITLNSGIDEVSLVATDNTWADLNTGTGINGGMRYNAVRHEFNGQGGTGGGRLEIQEYGGGLSSSGGYGNVYVSTAAITSAGSLVFVNDLGNVFPVQDPSLNIWKWSSLVTTNPPAGNIRFDDTTYADATNIYVAQEALWSIDRTQALTLVDTGDVIRILSGIDAEGSYFHCRVSGTPTDNGAWWTIPITYIGHSGGFTSSSPVNMEIDYVGSGVHSIGAEPPPVTATTAELEAIANAINTDAAKVQGYQVYNTTDDRPVWAADDTDGGLWNYADGTLAHTPIA